MEKEAARVNLANHLDEVSNVEKDLEEAQNRKKSA